MKILKMLKPLKKLAKDNGRVNRPYKIMPAQVRNKLLLVLIMTCGALNE